MSVAAAGRPLSAFAGELLARVQQNLIEEGGVPGRGAFGRVVQEALAVALRSIDPEMHDNRGAGTPDCWCRLGARRCACEIKYTDDGEVTLGERDVEGMQLGGEAEGARLIVLDIAFPARLWILDAVAMVPGDLRPAAHAHLHQADEAERLGERLESLLRLADVDLIGSENEAKEVLAGAAARLRPAPSSPR